MKIQPHANTFITMAILFTFMKHLFSWQIICQVHCTHAGNSLGIKQFYMWTRKCRCVFTRLPPSCLIYCICAPSRPRVFRLRFFSPRIWVTFYFTSAHLAYFVFLIFFCRGHFSGSGIFGLRFIWCPTWAGSHLGSDLFSDASTLTNRPQICRFKSKIYHQCFNSDWNILSCSRDRESEGQPVPNQRLREGAAHSTRGQRTSRHSFWKSLCTCKRTSRCEYNHPIYIQNYLLFNSIFVILSFS